MRLVKPHHEFSFAVPGASQTGRGSRVLRSLDRIAGIPVIWCLGKLRTKHGLLPGDITRIGILETAAIGDTTLSSAALYDLRDSYPGAHMVFFAGSSNVAIAKLLGVADQVIELPVANPLRACQMLRQFRFDLLLDFGPWPRINALLSHFARAKFKVGFKTPGQYRHYIYDRWVDHSDEQHELENFRGLVREIGVKTTRTPGFPHTVGHSDTLGHLIPEGPYVVFHLWPGGYRSKLKEWPVQKWLELGRKISSMGLRIILTGASADRDKNAAVIARMAAEGAAGSWADCAGCTLDQTIGILRRSRLVVCVDTGVMHLAAAVGSPVIGLHGPTSPRRWGAVGEHAVAVSAPGPGCGYLSLGLEYPAHCDCMLRITVGQVFHQCLVLLEQNVMSRYGTEAARPCAIEADVERKHCVMS